MHTVAGLDLSLSSAGVAILPPTGAPVYWTLAMEMAKHPTERDRIERVIWITNQIMGKLKEHGVQFVGIEDYAFSGHGLTRLAELTGNLKVQVYLGLRAVPLMIAANSVRKYHLGKDPPAKVNRKQKLQDYLKSVGYVGFRNLDESDALGVALVIDDWANRRSTVADMNKIEVLDRLDLHQTKSIKPLSKTKQRAGAT